MTDAVYNKVQLGQQSAVGTAVAATTVFPVDAGFLGFQLDRGTQSPDEDFGSNSREYPGRESHGIRWATASLPFVARFQDFMHVQQMHFDTVTTTGGGPYTHTSIFDESAAALSAALKPYTIQYGVAGSTQDEHRATGCLATGLTLGFDALSAPGNSMWKGTLDLVALNRAPSAMTSAQSPPATLETMEGHTTTLSAKDTGTAFGSLTAITGSLKQFSLSSQLNAVGRAYGGSTDIPTAIGVSGKGTVDFDMLIAISSANKTEFEDTFEVSGSVASERRFRLSIAGTGTNAATLDWRGRYRAVDIGEHDGERLYACKGVFVYDSTLASRGMWVTTNSVATIP